MTFQVEELLGLLQPAECRFITHSFSLLSICSLIPSKHHARTSCYPTIIVIWCQGQQKITNSGVSYLLTLWIKKFSPPKMRNREFVFTPKIEYELVAERSEANLSNL
jgi:hypothetical protein